MVVPDELPATHPAGRGPAAPAPPRVDLVAVLDDVAALGQEPTKQGVLDRLVDLARSVVGARFAAALLTGPDGQATALAHQGMTTGQVAEMPHLPRPVGLLGLVLTGRTLRLEDMRTHPGGVGLPTRHTPMAALLGIPIRHHGEVVGGLYLSRPPGHGTFDDTDEALTTALAVHAGACVGALREARQSRELLTVLATTDGHRPPHPDDGAARVSAVVRRLVAAARTTTGLQTAALTHVHGSSQTFTVVDTAPGAGTGRGPDAGRPHARQLGAHPGLLVEGTTIDLAQGYCGLVLDETLPATVPDVRAHPVLGPMPVTTDLGVGAYCGVPVRLPDGTVHGTLCGLGPDPTTPLTSTQLGALTALAQLLGAQLAREERHRVDHQDQQRALAPYLDGRRRTTVVQPIVDLATGEPAGYEALTRFRDPGGAPRRPDLVFAEATRLGLGVALEQATAADALTWLPHVPPGRYLSVNLSAQALQHPATYDLLTRAIATSPGAAGARSPRLVVELTEHDHVEDYPTLVRALDGLRARGVHLAIDDTGSGYASLQHLTRLHPDVVKLDMTFVRDVHTEPARRAIARALVGLADDIGASLVAEGIETAHELEALVQLGATHGQGYHLARPAPPHTHLPAAPGPPAPAPAQRSAPPRRGPLTGARPDDLTTPAPSC